MVPHIGCCHHELAVHCRQAVAGIRQTQVNAPAQSAAADLQETLTPALGRQGNLHANLGGDSGAHLAPASLRGGLHFSVIDSDLCANGRAEVGSA